MNFSTDQWNRLVDAVEELCNGYISLTYHTTSSKGIDKVVINNFTVFMALWPQESLRFINDLNNSLEEHFELFISGTELVIGPNI